ncbi:S16 family serine protease [Lactococcus ileimucosae]
MVTQFNFLSHFLGEFFNRKIKLLVKGASIALGGAVWPVGGIRQKVIAAERQEMDVFFVYDDGTTQNSNNYIQAKNTAEWLHSDMSIVPINTVRDAVEYLEGQGTAWLEGSDKKSL